MKYDKPDIVGADDFGFALNLINPEAIIQIMQYGKKEAGVLKIQFVRLTRL